MFMYRSKIVANRAAFKAHASFGTWRRDAESKAILPDGVGRALQRTSSPVPEPPPRPSPLSASPGGGSRK